LHALPTKQNNITPINYKILNGGSLLKRMVPVNLSLAINNRESKQSITMKVFSIHCQLARERNGRGGNQTRGREEKNK